jgi:NADPH:quinone reductase-like Zn-dependent oxidoreductase
MRAAVYDTYGPPEVVTIRDVETPVPQAGEVLIQVKAASVSSGDWRMRSMELPDGFGPLAPLIFGSKPKQKILGTELSGVIAAVGTGASEWKVGDEVVAFPGIKMGAHAEFACMKSSGKIARKPPNLSFTEAAALFFGGHTVLSFLERSGGIRAGAKFLVVGASGSVGSAAVQIAHQMGAEVTGVCSSRNAELIRSIGAKHVIAYDRDPFPPDRGSFDLVLDAVGTLGLTRGKTLLGPGGKLLLVMASFGDMVRSMFSAAAIGGPVAEKKIYIDQLCAMAAGGSYKPVIDKVYPLAEIAAAHRHVDSGRKIGNVVVTI